MLTILGHFPGINIGEIDGQVSVLPSGKLKVNYGTIARIERKKWSLKVFWGDENTEIIEVNELSNFCDSLNIPYIELWDLQARAYFDLMKD